MSVAEARRFVRKRAGHAAGWTDRYMVVAAVVIVGALALAPMRAVAQALSTSEPRPLWSGLVPVAVATTAVMGAMRWLGPVAMPANDVRWLLLSPLARSEVLRRPVFRSIFFFLGTSSASGLAALSVLGTRDQLAARMVLAMVLGAALALAGWVVALQAQRVPARRWTVPLAGVAAAPALLLTRAPLPVDVLGVLAVVVLAAVSAFAARRMLADLPAWAVVAASQRLGTATDATIGLQPSDFTRAAEDRYWQARRLNSRPWPGFLPAPLLMAWPDWRMLGRRPARLALIATSAVIPALLDGVAATVVMFGLSLAVASTGTTSVRRGIALSSLPLVRLGFACLPTALTAGWLAIALTLTHPGKGLWLLGIAAAPSVAVAALRMARRGPIDHTSVPIVMPMSGSWIPTGWIIWSLTGLDIAVPACLPLIWGMMSPPPVQPLTAIVAQTVVSATVVGVWCGRR